MSAVPSRTVEQVGADVSRALIAGPIGIALAAVTMLFLMWLLMVIAGVKRNDRAKFILDACTAIIGKLTQQRGPQALRRLPAVEPAGPPNTEPQIEPGEQRQAQVGGSERHS